MKILKNVSCEIPKETAGKLKSYLRDMHIKFEPSECGNLIHFEVWATLVEIDKANAFISANC